MNGRILVVEDNNDNRILMSDMLTSLGYVILEAVNGEQGLEIASQEIPDLIFMDLSLPVMDGWSATKHLKNNPKLRNIPIIALTAHALVGDQERALEAGCDDYISKPISFDTLKEKLQEYLDIAG